MAFIDYFFNKGEIRQDIMVDIVQKLPYGKEDGTTQRYLEIKCVSCSLINDIEAWMLGCFLEVNCDYCGNPLDVGKVRKD